jgi:hypothetical protein
MPKYLRAIMAAFTYYKQVDIELFSAYLLSIGWETREIEILQEAKQRFPMYLSGNAVFQFSELSKGKDMKQIAQKLSHRQQLEIFVSWAEKYDVVEFFSQKLMLADHRNIHTGDVDFFVGDVSVDLTFFQRVNRDLISGFDIEIQAFPRAPISTCFTLETFDVKQKYIYNDVLWSKTPFEKTTAKPLKNTCLPLLLRDIQELELYGYEMDFSSHIVKADEKTEKELICPICYENKKNAVLSCGHAFCQFCLLYIVKQKQYPHCSICRKVFHKKTIYPLLL